MHYPLLTSPHIITQQQYIIKNYTHNEPSSHKVSRTRSNYRHIFMHTHYHLLTSPHYYYTRLNKTSPRTITTEIIQSKTQFFHVKCTSYLKNLESLSAMPKILYIYISIQAQLQIHTHTHALSFAYFPTLLLHNITLLHRACNQEDLLSIYIYMYTQCLILFICIPPHTITYYYNNTRAKLYIQTYSDTCK